MIRCPVCHVEAPEGARFCPSCGAALGVSGAATRVTRSSAPGYSSSDSLAQGRFVPGTMLAGRYRVVGLLGKGGMGEVYRADDLKLGQPVALKFLPEAVASNPERLARFHNEVRLARQVSHPNVCRVYDIGEADGHHFITMEYVDGEDLASLLRRIGRLPRDKSVEIARQICAGLAAAHDRGVLHRDLKPANIMIDGRGRARINDFGLAGVAGSVRGAEARAGTPSYMSPEQIEGREVTARSDIYCLGLTLYEMFTGKPAYKADTLAELVKARSESAPATPSSLVPGFDPAVERVILRCLAKDPASRPATPLAVAAALPGGDPLAAALAAGETPSPEMVAAAGVEGALRPAVAWSLLGAFVAGVAILVALSGRTSLVNRVPLEKPPEVLADRARDLIAKLGQTAPAADVRCGFAVDEDYLHHVERIDPSPHRWDHLGSGLPPAIYFWYRQSPAPMVARTTFAVVDADVPPLREPGMTRVLLDTRGRLIGFDAVPPEHDAPATPAAAPTPPDWAVLFAESGLDPSRFTPAAPEWNPRFYADTRAAWTGTLVERPDLPLRIEAGGYRGRPVFFHPVAAWSRSKDAEAAGSAGAGSGPPIGYIALQALTLAGALVLARRNLRLGRGDRSGAFKISIYFTLVHIVVWALWVSHVPSPLDEWRIFSQDTGWTLFNAVFLWLAYMGLEPYVRRVWPDTVISWNRLLAGRVRDPLVGRDLLVGSLLGVGCSLVFASSGPATGWLGLPPAAPVPPSNTADLLGLRYNAAHLLDIHVHSLLDSMMALFVMLILRIALRREGLAIAAFSILIGLMVSAGQPNLWVALPFAIGAVLLLAIALTRFGLVAAGAGAIMTSLFGRGEYVMSPNFTAWYAGGALLGLAAALAIGLYGFHTALAGRPAFRAFGEEVMAE